MQGHKAGIVVRDSEVVAQGVYHFGLAVTELRARNQTEPFEEIDNEKYGGRIGVRKTGTEAQSIHKERTGPGEELVIPPRLVQRTFSGAHRVSRGVKGLGKGLPALGILEKDIGRFQVSIQRKMPGKPADVAHFQNHIVPEIALNGEVGGVIPALFMVRVVGYRQKLKPWIREGGKNNRRCQGTSNGQSNGSILPNSEGAERKIIRSRIATRGRRSRTVAQREGGRKGLREPHRQIRGQEVAHLIGAVVDDSKAPAQDGFPVAEQRSKHSVR